MQHQSITPHIAGDYESLILNSQFKTQQLYIYLLIHPYIFQKCPLSRWKINPR